MFLWKWNDLPPGRLIPQASALSRRGCRDLVMVKGALERRGQGAWGDPKQNRNTSPQSPVDEVQRR
jgi:hypothetical protein